MKSRSRSERSKNLQKDGVIVIFSALLASLLKIFAGAAVTSFLNGTTEAGGGVAYYLPVIVAHLLIFALIDVVFFFVLKSQNIKYGIKTYIALAVIPVVFFASQLIFLILSSSTNRPSIEPVIIWLIMSLGFSLFTAGIGCLIKLLPRRA